MKSWRGLDKEQDAVKTALCDVGELLSRPFHERARELIIKLSKFKGVTIKYLVMGNGTFLMGIKTPWREEFKGNVEEGVHENVDIGDFNDSKSRPNELYELANPGIGAVAQELDEILMYLNDEPYLTLLNIDEEEMVKLLGNKVIKPKKSAKKA
jgi:hypothetical protein